VISLGQLRTRRQNGALSEASVRMSARQSHALAQERRVLQLWLLQNTNRKTRARGRTDRQRSMANRSRKNVLEAEKTYFVNISKTKRYEATVTIKHE